MSSEVEIKFSSIIYVKVVLTYVLFCCLLKVEALPEVISAVNGECEVYLDGGIRYGSDVFKALALGARAVFVGRPIVWGLAYKVK